jgi:hypothetical protein
VLPSPQIWIGYEEQLFDWEDRVHTNLNWENTVDTDSI